MTAPKGRTYDRTVPVASSVAKEHLARGGVPHMRATRMRATRLKG